MSGHKVNMGAALASGFNRAIESQYPLAVKNVERLRRLQPTTSPGELIAYLNKLYIGAVAATGAGAGATAAVPNLAVQIPVALADALSFLDASVLYTLSVAEVCGLNPEDAERRRLLIMTVLAGNGAATVTLEGILGRSVPYWGKKIVQGIPMTAVDAANKLLGPRFITKWGTKTGVLVLGKQVPYFIGMGVGAAGNVAFAWFIIKAARKILGVPPESWDSMPTEAATSEAHAAPSSESDFE